MLLFPLLYEFVVSIQKNRWHFMTFIDFWTRILRKFKSIKMIKVVAFLLKWCGFFDNSRNQSHDRLCHHHRWRLTTQRHKFPKRDFLKIFRIKLLHDEFKTMIYSLISSTYKNQIFNLLKFKGKSLIEFLFARRQKKYLIRAWKFLNNSINRIDHRLNFDQHALTTTIDFIINLLMFVETKIPWIDRRNGYKMIVLCFFDQWSIWKTFKNLRKNSNICDMHIWGIMF